MLFALFAVFWPVKSNGVVLRNSTAGTRFSGERSGPV